MKKRKLTVALDDPDTLAPFLAARLELGVSQATALVARGSIHVDGRRVRDATTRLSTGARLTVFLDGAQDVAPFQLVHQDEWVLVVEKPAGIASQATRAEAASSLDEQVRERFPDARMMHRLDRDASGLVLFARTPAARAPLQQALEEGKIERHYVAIARGRLEGSARVTLRIARDPADERKRMALPDRAPGGEKAATRWTAVEHGVRSTLLAVELETGRTHQIRVHLSALGHPLLGDRLYGGPPAERLCLHATRLTFDHPKDARRVDIASKSPLGPPP
jgi:RluA family pseudouridine synthase